MSDFKDIWTPGDGGESLSEEQLTAYLEGRLSNDEQHAIEALLSSEGMESDALEGLQSLSADEARSMKVRLNAGLQKALGKKRRSRRGIAELRWNVIAIIVVLILLAVCFGMYWMMRRQ